MSLISTASILLLLHACSLLAAARVPDPVQHGDVNTAMLTNGSATPSSPDSSSNGNFDMYLCFLCSGRDPLLIHHCPIYWDECHLVLVCYGDQASDSIPAVPVPTSLGPAASANPSELHEDECYVMKLYWNGSYAIVTRLGYARIARCLLSCGGGDMAGSDRDALGTTTAAPATTAALQGRLTSRLADLQRCSTQVTTPSLHGAVVVRARG